MITLVTGYQTRGVSSKYVQLFQNMDPARKPAMERTVLIGRMTSGQDQADLVDVLFALTSFEMFDASSVRRRSDAAVEALIQELVDDSLKRPRGKSRERELDHGRN